MENIFLNQNIVSRDEKDYLWNGRGKKSMNGISDRVNLS